MVYGVFDLSDATEVSECRGRNHRVRLEGLDPGKTYQGQIVTSHEDEAIRSEVFTFLSVPPKPEASKALEIVIAVPEPTENARQAWPATIGMPFSRGVLADSGDLALYGPDGGSVTLQADTFSRWPDGSVKWATLSWLADTRVAGDSVYTLRPGGERAPAASPLVRVEETAASWRIEAGALAFDVAKDAADLLQNVGYDRNGDGIVADDERIASEEQSNLTVVGEDGTLYTCGPPDEAGLLVEQNGPVQAIVKWSGSLVDGEGAPGWSYLARVRLWKGMPVLAINVTVGNDRPQPNHRALTSIALQVPLSGSGGVQGSLDGAPMSPVPDGGMTLLQDKDNHLWREPPVGWPKARVRRALRWRRTGKRKRRWCCAISGRPIRVRT